MHDQFGNLLMPLNSAEILGADDDLSIRSIPFPNQTVVSLSTERGFQYREEGRANQDRIATGLIHYEGELITLDLICDGMGGYYDVSGDVAAQLCAEAFQEFCEDQQRQLFHKLTLPQAIATDILQRTLKKYDQAQLTGNGGTTFLLAVTRGAEVTLFNIGDSPALLIEAETGKVLARTKDHKPAEFEQRFKLTTALDHNSSLDELLSDLRMTSYDISSVSRPCFLILCSDGISDNLKSSYEDQEYLPQFIQLASEYGSTEELCEAFMNEARSRMNLYGTDEGNALDVKPDNLACLVRFLRAA